MATIRIATNSDVDQLCELGKEVSEFSVNEATVNFWPKSILIKAITSADVIILVAEEDNNLVGFIIATYNTGFNKSTIENILVAPHKRGSGIGKKLLDSLIKLLVEAGCKYIATLIPAKAREASKLYQSAGFSVGEEFVWLDISISEDFKRY